ncbi:N6-adenosine-methyltransferase MT-A70-like protein [Rhagoletis pomonella]|uniref:N6-adenosine-methyltransferase MT-A70-like protein n=1 Tax=Rhagoletis pomonella TaxID=28610 RepID=UPI00177F567F|nr:N6-adenosine-methyltransferase MT-A70-like protein [Rhagoletis pomonella]XP_036343892.1 N6-adenosine-methyltransferase MT-A70-like protein [Rhagoletis pomonella]
MADAWDEIKAVKTKRNTLREKLEKRKKERAGLLSSSPNNVVDTAKDSPNPPLELETDAEAEKAVLQALSSSTLVLPIISTQLLEKVATFLDKAPAQQVINYTLNKLAEQGAVNIKSVTIGKDVGCEVISVETNIVLGLYKELINDSYVGIKEELKRKFETDDAENEDCNLNKMVKAEANAAPNARKETTIGGSDASDDIMSLLSMPSTREKQSKQVGEEILELLTKPTAKERSVAEKFKSHGGAQVMEFCPHGTKVECLKAQQATAEMAAKKKRDHKLENARKAILDLEGVQKNNEETTNMDDANATSDSNGNTSAKEEKNDAKAAESDAEDGEIVSDNLKDGEVDSEQSSDELLETLDTCTKLHFKKIIQSHTDESLGDCSFLNTCFHMATCKYVHYEVDTIPNINTNKPVDVKTKLCIKRSIDPSVTLYPPQWIQCDLRYLDMTVLGKFAVVMADPPWDIHMELPYGTMSDDEMRQLGVPALQDDGLIFLWVTGRAMELGRECLKLWGYERVDELIWVKTNQLQRIIRTGRTGHWLNHGKEHCLVGMKGNPKNLNRGLDCDVIVAEVRATSHKPDEIYGIIERLSPGTRKIELFGRPHNVQPNWITLGNQLDGIRLVDPELITQFQKRYPDGNCMSPAAAAGAAGSTTNPASTPKK